jgi:hypothetical protein
MKEIRLKIAELFQIDAPSRDDAKDLAEVTAYVLKHYAFLPKPIVVTIDGDEITLFRHEAGRADNQRSV